MSPKVSPAVNLPTDLAETLATRLGAPLSDITAHSANPWNRCFALMAGEDRYFLKTYEADDQAQQEAQGLLAIKKTKTIRVPEVVGWGPRYLILEWVEPGPVDWTRLGQQLASLHRQSNRVFGWSQLNYIGALPQYNGIRSGWGAFFGDQRLGSQLRLARQRQSLDPDLILRLERSLPKLARLVEVKEKPALVHGDLWRGNVMATADGTPVLVDPAVSYSSREVDVAMSELFGGFPEAFYTAYQEAFPLSSGYPERKPVLLLYYLLVHANLFGAPYPDQIDQTLSQLGL